MSFISLSLQHYKTLPKLDGFTADFLSRSKVKRLGLTNTDSFSQPVKVKFGFIFLVWDSLGKVFLMLLCNVF